MADRDDRAGIGKLVVAGPRRRVLPKADATDDVIAGVGNFQRILDHADVVGMTHRKRAVVEKTNRRGQRVALGQFEQFTSGTGGVDIGTDDQQWSFGVQQGVTNLLNRARIG